MTIKGLDNNVNGYKRCILDCNKLQDYPADADVYLPEHTTMFATQNGKFVDYVLADNEPITFKLSDLKGLKKSGLFSKKYKNVVCYWFHHQHAFINSATVMLMDEITTPKGRRVKVQLSINPQFKLMNFENFFETCKKLNVNTSEDGIVYSISFVQDIVERTAKDRIAKAIDNNLSATLSGVTFKKMNFSAAEINDMIEYIATALAKIGFDLATVSIK